MTWSHVGGSCFKMQLQKAILGFQKDWLFLSLVAAAAGVLPVCVAFGGRSRRGFFTFRRGTLLAAAGRSEGRQLVTFQCFAATCLVLVLGGLLLGRSSCRDGVLSKLSSCRARLTWFSGCGLPQTLCSGRCGALLRAARAPAGHWQGKGWRFNASLFVFVFFALAFPTFGRLGAEVSHCVGPSDPSLRSANTYLDPV